MASIHPLTPEARGRPTCASRAVIVGNGSSVDAMPPAFWRSCREEGVMLIGASRVLCFDALADVSWDVLVIRDTYRNLWCDQRLGALYHDQLWKPHPAWKVGPADRRVTHCDEFVRQEPFWQHVRTRDANGEAAVMKNSSVVLMAANWAWLAGARELYLVGVDYRGGYAQMAPPYGGRALLWQGQYDRAVPESIEKQFAHAAAAVRDGGGRMVNLSVNTRLQAVGRESWRESRPCLR